ncbi:hypothetical protein D3C85_1059060 [compost metagenome]
MARRLHQARRQRLSSPGQRTDRLRRRLHRRFGHARDRRLRRKEPGRHHPRGRLRRPARHLPRRPVLVRRLDRPARVQGRHRNADLQRRLQRLHARRIETGAPQGLGLRGPGPLCLRRPGRHGLLRRSQRDPRQQQPHADRGPGPSLRSRRRDLCRRDGRQGPELGRPLSQGRARRHRRAQYSGGRSRRTTVHQLLRSDEAVQQRPPGQRLHRRRSGAGEK